MNLPVTSFWTSSETWPSRGGTSTARVGRKAGHAANVALAKMLVKAIDDAESLPDFRTTARIDGHQRHFRDVAAPVSVFACGSHHGHGRFQHHWGKNVR